MVPRALAAAKELAEVSIEASVLDLRWLNPLDEGALKQLALNVGGRILIVHEAVRTGGFAGEIAFRLSEMDLNVPLLVRRLTTPDIRMPASAVLQAAVLPGSSDIVRAVRDLMQAVERKSDARLKDASV
jgi:2-oxoisovalerate dehydrogenase E1 component